MDLYIIGKPLSVDSNIDLKKGWNLIGYNCQSPQAVEKIFGEILSVLVKVKNIQYSYDPNIQPFFNMLKDLILGEGYWLNVSEDITLHYLCTNEYALKGLDMRISKIKYFDQLRHWNLNSMTFKNLTLLVGVSGVGKTQILKSILNLRKISKGSSINGLKWEIEFFIQDDIYIWQGEFEKIQQENDIILMDSFENEDDDAKKDIPKILCEKLYKNKSEIIRRDIDKILFKNVKTVKLPQEKSVINLLKEEDEISIIYKNFQKIAFHDHSEAHRISHGDMNLKLEKYKHIEDIQESDESVRTKLYLTFYKSKTIFNLIKDKFIDVFPYVENIKIEPVSSKKLPLFLQDIPFIQIKEKGIDHWIDERQVSSGMLRTLLHISELYLGSNGTVILVDEFENSLGVNCIDEMTNELIINKRDLQFIITSHHPYIINNISYANWKIVTRKAGDVSSRDATDFNLSKSKHEAFTQLINLDEYSEGVEV